MVDNQHKLIKGYRDLSEDEIALMNQIKTFEESLGTLWRNVQEMPSTNARWVSIARTHFEEGFMALVRSVAKPESKF